MAALEQNILFVLGKIHDTNAQHVSNIYYLLFFGEEEKQRNLL